MSETNLNVVLVKEDRNMFLGHSLSEQNKQKNKPSLTELGEA